ncbi:PIN2/TERF1-interacting telomerase inhibitor 1 isoform X2 [Drosophila serrata]|uniref:PIN2/TERF1-interacting telomerase inhibitor 1 isoform X2 n=1 Tax=Drosophila serrata TaxID=7274 RepID=UPI000A1D0C4A|nr:PIN2/TERF1-interacting telomerase inhibitor 1 isoform X2 [Drosophila serrata]
MAMLAEPRRRKRYNLCPRGKALYEDDNRFGTKMLEKMGWSKGNGLGARQDGEKDFVRIRFKNDAEGLGYEAKDDQWTTHEEGFNGLLKSLNGGEDDKEANGKASESEEETRPMGFGFKADDPEEPPSKKKLKEDISGMSLEQRSKQSKARVHYQKFTRGKDLSQYSEKDLANIFGKKATEDIAVPVVIEEPKEEQTVSPNFGGVQTVSTGLSVNDYFKQKMEAIKNKLKIGSTPENRVGEAQVNGSEVDVEEPNAENVSEEPIKKKKKRNAESTVEPQITEPKKKKKSERSQEETKGVGETCVDPVEGEETIVKKKKKKSKRSSPDEAEELEATFVEPKPAEDKETIVKKKKKNKKDKADKKEETTDTVIETIEIVDEPAPKKKRSKKTEGTESEIILIDDNSNSRDDHGTNESEVMDELVRIKKKKSKKCEEIQNQDTNVVSEEKESPPKKKKKSKQDKTNIKPEETIQTDSPDADSTEKTSKKKKKSKAHVDEPVPEDATPELEPAFDTIDTDKNSNCSI